MIRQNLPPHILGLVTLTTLQVIDYASTQYALQHGGVEANPVVASLGQTGSFALKLAIVGAIWLYAALGHGWPVRATVSYASLASTATVAWNGWGIAQAVDPTAGAIFTGLAAALGLAAILYTFMPLILQRETGRTQAWP